VVQCGDFSSKQHLHVQDLDKIVTLETKVMTIQQKIIASKLLCKAKKKREHSARMRR